VLEMTLEAHHAGVTKQLGADFAGLKRPPRASSRCRWSSASIVAAPAQIVALTDQHIEGNSTSVSCRRECRAIEVGDPVDAQQHRKIIWVTRSPARSLVESAKAPSGRAVAVGTRETQTLGPDPWARPLGR
jgi:hypothetical protein